MYLGYTCAMIRFIVHQVSFMELGYASNRMLTVIGPMLMVLDRSNRGGELRISPQNRSCLCTATWAAMRPPCTLQKGGNDINNTRQMFYHHGPNLCNNVLPKEGISILRTLPHRYGATMANVFYVASHSNHEVGRGVSAIISE